MGDGGGINVFCLIRSADNLKPQMFQQLKKVIACLIFTLS
jgi:hypothetical protein